MLLTSIGLFPTLFSKGLFLRVVISRGTFEKGKKAVMSIPNYKTLSQIQTESVS